MKSYFVVEIQTMPEREIDLMEIQKAISEGWKGKDEVMIIAALPAEEEDFLNKIIRKG